MKKFFALILVIILVGSAALAAEWPAGRSAAQPYEGSPEIDLTKTVGYIILYPRAKMPAKTFCDTLEIFLPREDIELADGTVALMELVEGEAQEVCSANFAESASLRAMTEAEMNTLRWGSGVVVEIKLPVSLEFGEHQYYVTMTEGCFTAAKGTLPSLTIAKPEAWAPVIQGDYGVSGLRYTDGELAPEATPEPEIETEIVFDMEPDAEDGEEEPEETPEPTPEPEEDEEAVDEGPVADPDTGDDIRFDLVMGGDAAFAVIYSDNDSVYFDEIQYESSTEVTGKVVKDDLSWGVVFLDANGGVLQAIDLSR